MPRPAPTYYYSPPKPLQPLLVTYEERRHRGLIIGGSVLFGTFYSLNLAWGAADPEVRELAVPVFGPLILAGRVDYPGARAALIFDFLGQAAGLTMLICGAVLKKKVPIYVWPSQQMSVLPSAIGKDGAGVTVSARW